MARKKKKLSRKQLKQQRQEIITRKRQEQGWTPPKPATSRRGQDEVIADIQPLLKNISMSSKADMEELMMILMDTADLAEEPELKGIIIDPVLCVDTLVEVGEELGIGPSSLDTLSNEDIDDDQQLEMLTTTIQRVLTEEVRQEIYDSLDNLRLRLKRSGTPKEVARVAAVQSFLHGDADDDEFLSIIGLVQAIVYRSLETGFAMLETSADLMEVIETDDDDTPLTLLQKLNQSELTKKAESMLKKIPGLGGFLEKQADKVWDEGRKALHQGDLYLELFTEEELIAGFEIFGTTFTNDLDVDKVTPQTASKIVTKEKMKTFVFKIKDYVTKLLTPERLEQLRAHLNGVLDDPDLPKKWAPFVLMLSDYVADDEIGESESLFFAFTFIGEFQTVSKIMKDEK